MMNTHVVAYEQDKSHPNIKRTPSFVSQGKQLFIQVESAISLTVFDIA
jgi:hypothetical protein